MAVAFVQSVDGRQTGTGTSVSSASITPTNGNHLLIFINMRIDQAGVDPSISGGGLTYTPLQEASGEGNGWLYIAEVTGSPGAMTVSATYGTGSRAVILVLEYSGASGQGASAFSAASTVNLTTTANDSMLVVFRSRGSETTPTAPTSHTLREFLSSGGTAAGRISADSSELLVATAGATSTEWSATTFFDLFAVELLEDSGGGTEHTQDVAGSVTPSGAATKQTSRLLSGAVGLSGAILRSVSRLLAGALTPSGALVRGIYAAAAGSVAPSGDQASQSILARALAGTLGIAGAVSRQVSRAITGALAPAAMVVRAVTRAITGSVTPSGEAVGQAVLLRALEGVLSLSGAVGRGVSRSVAGALSPVGAVGRSVARSITGALGLAGTVSRAISRLVMGVVAPAGTVAGEVIAGAIEVFLTGAVGISGAISRTISRNAEGNVTPSGAVSRAISRALSGAVGLAGSMATAGKFIGNTFRAMWRGLFKGMR